MTWENRLKPAAYTSPSGIRILFDYEDVSKSINKKTNAFDFPDANGTYIQDLGNTGKRYPLRIIFWGDDHDLSAAEFENLLTEIGSGILEHPSYGSINVVPFGDINFRNDLKTSANQTIIELTFWETIVRIYPIDQADPVSDVLTAIDEFNNVEAEAFEDLTKLDTVSDIANFKNKYESLLDSVESGIQSIASTQQDVQKYFDSVNDSINNGIDILISQPLTLAYQTSIMIQAPARAITSIRARLNAYENLVNTIIGNTPEDSNELHTNDLYASNYIIGSILSTINNQFVTKIDALESAERVLTQMDDFTTWRDSNFETLEIVDTGEAYQQLQSAVALTVRYLVEISFNLKQERVLVLESPTTIINLIHQLYPVDTVIDDELDFFIQSNDLTGSEILEIPRGRKVVYYV